MRAPWIIRIGVAALLLFGVGTQVGGQTEGPREPLGMAWSRPADGVVAVSVTGDGSRVLAADGRGVLSCYESAGPPIWTRRVGPVDRVAVSRGREMILACATRRPLARGVHLFNAAGRSLGSVQMDRMIETAVVNPEGKLAVAAVGDAVHFLIPSRRGEVIRRRVPLEGKVTHLEPGPGDSAYVALADPIRVLLVRSTGRVAWERRLDGVTQCSLAASENGELLALGAHRPGVAEGLVVELLDHRNRTRWSVTRPGRSPRLKLSATGNAVLLSFEHRMSQRLQGPYEQRLEYLDARGNRAWIKGGAFTAPLCASVAPDGDWVVALDTQRHDRSNSFLLYGRGAERRWLYECPANVVIARSSMRGRHIAAYRQDGVLELVQVDRGQDGP